MRPVSFQRGWVKHPAGSCLVSFGETRVFCTASLEREVPPYRKGKGGWLTAEYAMLPGSTSPRKRRDALKPDGRSVEIQRLIGRSLRAAVDLDALGDVTIALDCDVLQADGGTRTASITGAWVALHDALSRLAADRGLASPPAAWLKGSVAAVSVGLVDGRVEVDLDYAKDSRAEVDMNVVMRGEDFIEVQGTGEQGVFSKAQLDELLESARGACSELQRRQREAVAG